MAKDVTLHCRRCGYELAGARPDRTAMCPECRTTDYPRRAGERLSMFRRWSFLLAPVVMCGPALVCGLLLTAPEIIRPSSSTGLSGALGVVSMLGMLGGIVSLIVPPVWFFAGLGKSDGYARVFGGLCVAGVCFVVDFSWLGACCGWMIPNQH